MLYLGHNLADAIIKYEGTNLFDLQSLSMWTVIGTSLISVGSIHRTAIPRCPWCGSWLSEHASNSSNWGLKWHPPFLESPSLHIKKDCPVAQHRVCNPRPENGLWSQTVLIRGTVINTRKASFCHTNISMQIIKESFNLTKPNNHLLRKSGKEKAALILKVKTTTTKTDFPSL